MDDTSTTQHKAPSRCVPCPSAFTVILTIVTVKLLPVTIIAVLFPGCTGTHVAPDVCADCAGICVYVGNRSAKPYKPRSMLITSQHHPVKAAVAAIDFHCHWRINTDRDAMIRAMDERGVRFAVNLSGDHGEKLETMLAHFHDYAPDRFVIFCSPDFSEVDAQDFAPRMEHFIRTAHARGARGVKIYKNLGLTVRDRSGRIVPVDDPRFDAIWATAGELNMPVLIHTADPPAFFQPSDEHNERWMQLARHPDWSFHGDDFPTYEALLAQRNRVLARHRGTTFVGAHMGSRAGDLAGLAKDLAAHPNFYVDISGRVGELGRQPHAARAFIIQHADRVLFGTDRYPGRPEQPRYRIYYRFLETTDEYFDYFDHPFPPAGEWKIYGIHLPEAVLQRVYHDNAARILSM